jgi:hypothetical protein
MRLVSEFLLCFLLAMYISIPHHRPSAPFAFSRARLTCRRKYRASEGGLQPQPIPVNRSLVTFLSMWRYLAPMRFEVTTDGYAATWRPVPKMDGNDASLATASARTFGGYGKTTHSQSRPSRATRMRLLFPRVGRQFPDLIQVDMGSLPSNTTLISGDGEVVPYPRGTEGTSQTQW